MFLQMTSNVPPAASASPTPPLPTADIILTGPLAVVPPSATNGAPIALESAVSSAATPAGQQQHHQHHHNTKNHYYQNQQQASAAHSQYKKRMHTQPYQPARHQNGRAGGGGSYNSSHGKYSPQTNQVSVKYRAKLQTPNGTPASSAIAQ